MLFVNTGYTNAMAGNVLLAFAVDTNNVLDANNDKRAKYRYACTNRKDATCGAAPSDHKLTDFTGW
jgi:hypothetical protein